MTLVENEVQLRLVGKPVKRADAPERLTGQLRYAADLPLPGLLQARVVRSPYASARIVSVDKSAAERTPGVVAVLTATDLPVANLDEAIETGTMIMAVDRVVYAGQPVAVVVGETEAAAEDGALAVEVDYEVRGATVDPLEGLKPDAPVVREHGGIDVAELAEHGATAGGFQVEQLQAPNVASHERFSRGDVEQGFREADLVVEREYRTAWVHQSYMEPQVCAATVDPVGNVVVYASTQALFRTRNRVAALLGRPTRQVRVVPMPIGGGFGGKFCHIEPLVAALAVTVGRPVRMIFTRGDEFGAGNPAPSSIFRVKAGAKSDGTLVALKADVFFDAGAKPGAPAAHAGMCLAVFYRWQNFDIDVTEVLTHKTPNGAYRAPGLPQAMFASESLVDELAEKLGMDPLELRKKNVVHEGDLRPDGMRWPRIGLAECLERVTPLYEQERAAAGPDEGVGVALGGWFGGLEPSAALCQLEPDGTLHVTLGTVDLTGSHIAFQIIAAEAFGLDSVDRVRVTTVDSDAAPFAGASSGSKTIYTMGPSVLKAAQDARKRVLEIAAADMEAAVEDLELVDGEIRVKGVPGKVRTLRDIYRLSTAYGARHAPVVGKGESAIVQHGPGTAVHLARVRVDPDTGHIQPLRYVMVQDVGRAINPATVEGQIHGGGAQGVGWGMYEAIVHDENGTPITGSLMDYTIPKASQLPDLQAIMVEVPSPIGPYGARPVGEPPVIPGAAVIANAVHAATGARITELPVTAERVGKALLEQGRRDA